MRDSYYADKLDLIKWGTLVARTRQLKMKRIIQVAYYGESGPPTIRSANANGSEISFPEEVWTLMRNISNIELLNGKCGPLIVEVWKEPFSHDERVEYTKRLCERLKAQSKEPKLVFLDPDIGFNPEKGYNGGHVRVSEVGQIWSVLHKSDVLALFQHRYPNAKWQDVRREQFRQAVGHDIELKSYCGEGDYGNAIMFLAQKR